MGYLLDRANNKALGMTKAKYLNAQIGAKMRLIREAKKLTLTELGFQSGMSVGMLSKIENGRVFPTLSTLIHLLDVLGVDFIEFLSQFKGNYESSYTLIKSNDQQPREKEDSEGFQYNIILNSTIEKSSLEISLLHLAKDARRRKVSTSGMEFLYLIKGNIVYELNEELIQLEAGDAIFFDGNLPHVPHNNSSQEAVMLVIYFLNYD
jgi:transcriptional regulator with XRE-family HTH domain